MKNKIFNIILNIYIVFAFFATVILMCQILNHFGILNTGTGLIILCINIFLFPLIDNTKEEANK